MAEVKDKTNSNSKDSKSDTVFENSVRKYPVFDEEKLASVKYENDEEFTEDKPAEEQAEPAEETESNAIEQSETEEPAEEVTVKKIKSTPIPQKGASASPKPFYETKPSLLPSKTKEEKNVKKPALVTTPLGKINYRFAGKETFLQYIKNHLPKEFFPTPRIGPILGVIFIVVILYGLVVFGFGQMSNLFSTTPDTSLVIKVGLPMSFMVFDAGNPNSIPLKYLGLIVDLLVYLIVAYAIDVGLNYAESSARSLTTEERKKHPKVYSIKKEKTLAEKITNKIFEDY